MSGLRAASDLVAQARLREQLGRVRVDNDPIGLAAKVDLRRRVLEAMPGARVLDLFCGRGEMHRAVWRNAASYVGCDCRPWIATDPPRFVADNRRLLRSLDLQQFDVFDVDSWGSPWEQLEIIMHRRDWAVGEKGAVILTDGASASAKFRSGRLPNDMARIAGVQMAPRTSTGAGSMIELALRRWMERSRVKAVQAWKARRPTNHGGKSGGVDVHYVAVLFEGVP